MVLALLIGVLLCPGPAKAVDSDFFLDFSRVAVLPVGVVELTALHLRMDDHIDLFDFREREISAQTAKTFSGLGDLKGARLLANWGVFPATQLHSEYSWRNLDNGLLKMDIDSYELSVRQLVRSASEGRAAWAVDFGTRINRSGDQNIRSIAEIDLFVKRINRNYSISQSPSHLIISNGPGTGFFPRANTPQLQVSVQDLFDITPFVRVTSGWSLGAWEPALFIELGRSWVDSSIDSNLNTIVGTTFASLAADFPLKLDREETYAKAGVNLYGPGLFGTLGNLRYEYLRLDRPSGLDAVNYNHILKADLVLPVTPVWALNLGATYYRRQLNGVIPFLYNRYTQSSYDHDYGTVHLGLVARF
ncbi:MAG: hypothetical protein ACYDAI_01380 [Trichloromonadaceae bacterium]